MLREQQVFAQKLECNRSIARFCPAQSIVEISNAARSARLGLLSRAGDLRRSSRLAVPPGRLLAVTCSISVIEEQNGWDRYNQYLRVQGHRPVARVKRIARDTPIITRGATTANLPEPSDAWPAGKVSTYRARIPVEFLVGHRARPNDAHISPQDVE